MFCGEAEQPQTFISETSYVKIIFFAENYTDQVRKLTMLFDWISHMPIIRPVNDAQPPLQTYFSFDSRAEQQMEVYLRYGQHPELYPNRRGEVVQGWASCQNYHF